jgi:hypothetical protein
MESFRSVFNVMSFNSISITFDRPSRMVKDLIGKSSSERVTEIEVMVPSGFLGLSRRELPLPDIVNSRLISPKPLKSATGV